MQSFIWKNHVGGDCPLPPNAFVFIRLRNDTGYSDAASRGSSVAYRLRWDNLKSGGDIVEYAVDERKW